MPVPKKRQSKSKKNIRKSIWKKKVFKNKAVLKGKQLLKFVKLEQED